MPKPKAIEDQYGQQVEVGVVMSGDETTVSLEIIEYILTPPPAPLSKRREITHSKLTPDQARNLSTQLKEAADEIDPEGAA